MNHDDTSEERIDTSFKQLAELAKSDQWRRMRAEQIADAFANGDNPDFKFAPGDLELLKNWPLDLPDVA